MSGLGEVRGEAFDHFDDAEAEFVDGVASKLSVAEDYLDGKLAIHFHMGLALGVEAVSHGYCAVFERAVLVDDFKSAANGLVLEANVGLPCLPHDREGCVEGSVLVHVGGVDQGREGTSDRVVPSKVRLHVLDACPMVAMDSAQHRVEPSKGRGAFRVDRELVTAERLSVVEDDQLPYEVVEGCPKVMDDLTEEDAPRGVGIFADEDSLDKPLTLSLRLIGNQVRTSAHVGLDGGIESFQMVICPVEPKAGVR